MGLAGHGERSPETNSAPSRRLSMRPSATLRGRRSRRKMILYQLGAGAIDHACPRRIGYVRIAGIFRRGHGSGEMDRVQLATIRLCGAVPEDADGVLGLHDVQVS